MSDISEIVKRALETGVSVKLSEKEAAALHAAFVEGVKPEIDALRAENARLRAALMRVGDDYPGSSCQQWCYEQVGIAPMIDHAPDPLHVTIEDASIKRAAAFIAFGV